MDAEPLSMTLVIRVSRGMINFLLVVSNELGEIIRIPISPFSIVFRSGSLTSLYSISSLYSLEYSTSFLI